MNTQHSDRRGCGPGRAVWLAPLWLYAVSASAGPFATVLNIPPDPAPASIGSDTQLNLSAGGVLGASFEAGLPGVPNSNIEVNISGGSVGDGFRAYFGSEVNISGGTIGDNMAAESTVRVNIDGGAIGTGFVATNAEITLNDGSIDRLFLPRSNSTVVINGGAVGDSFSSSRSAVTVHGGTIGMFASISSGTMVVTGGTIGSQMSASIGGQVILEGGAIGDDLWLVSSSSSLTLKGGSIGQRLTVFPAATVNLFGSSFLLDGAPIPGLTPGVATILPDRGAGVILSGTLTDGSPFDFELNPAFGVGADTFDSTAIVTLTLVDGGEPLIGDLNGDGFVGAGDLDILLGVWNQNVGGGALADLNADGFIGAGDLDILLGNWNAGTPPGAAAAVPEPGAAAALAGLGLAMLTRRRRLRA